MTYANISIPVFPIVGEHRQAEYLSAEIEKIRSTLEMIERSEKQSAHMYREAEGKSVNSDSDSTGKNESKDIQGKIYKLDKKLRTAKGKRIKA